MRSGGIAFCVNEHLANFVKRIESNSDYIMLVQTDKCLIKVDENMLGVTYIPPTQSKYFNDEEILNLEREITSAFGSIKYLFIRSNR